MDLPINIKDVSVTVYPGLRVPVSRAEEKHRQRLEQKLDRTIDQLNDLKHLGQKRQLNRHERRAAVALSRRVARAQYGRYHAIKPKV